MEVTESTTINSRSYMKAGSGTEEWYMCLGVVMEAEIERFRVEMIIPELLFFSPSNQGSVGHTVQRCRPVVQARVSRQQLWDLNSRTSTSSAQLFSSMTSQNTKDFHCGGGVGGGGTAESA